MINYDIKVIGTLMNTMGQGVVYVDQHQQIQFCNRKAKEITGIVIDSDIKHEAGKIEEGDIVILADNSLGEDDGNIDTHELAVLNIKNQDIKQGDALVAVGIYRNKKIEAQYKFSRREALEEPLILDTNYYGFHIKCVVDDINNEILIYVNDKLFKMTYYSSVGHMVVIDGHTGEIKFFQAKGYTVRNEDSGKLLRGKSYYGKNPEDTDIDVIGKKFLDLFDQSAVSERIFATLAGQQKPILNHLYEINKRPFICNIIPWRGVEKKEIDGVLLLIQETGNLENLLDDRNEILKHTQTENSYQFNNIEKDMDYPEEKLNGFIGESQKTKEVKYMAYKASTNRFNVIITGESGTGKSKLAREIHMMGNPSAPFVEVNCNAIAPSLFESELFGYVKGAFTGAKNEGKIGFFEAADKGTIFLDEIGEIPLDFQVKLLHVLQNKIIYRVGSSKPIKVDVRVIAATNKNLEEQVALGKFRQDLFYRINVFPIEIPPLRERKADLYLLINQILRKTCETYGLELKQFSGEAFQKLISYNWPGNVRELENAIERAITLSDSNIIYSEHLRIGKGQIPRTMKEMLAKEEERILEMTLLKYNGDKQKAMDELEMSRSVFYSKLKAYNIKYYTKGE